MSQARGPYSVSMSEWMKTPIRRSKNPKTGLIEGDDSKCLPSNPGYRGISTLKVNPSHLVIPDVPIRSSYDGNNEYGDRRPEIALPGGFRDGQLMLRETAAQGIELLNQYVSEASDGVYQIAALDGFRSGTRQAAGFTRLLRQQMKLRDLTDTNALTHLEEFLKAADVADGTFSWVNLATGPQLDAAIVQVKSERHLMEQLEAIAAQKVIEHFDPALVEDEIAHYLTVGANSGIGHGNGLLLNCENNAHAGGGACDVFVIRTAELLPVNPVPFDYAGPEAGMDFMEKDKNFDAYLQAARSNQQLSNHLSALGFQSVDDFKLSDWNEMRDAIRLLYHASKAIGCTYYSAEVGGENWHLEPGNRVYDPATGDILAFEALTAGLHADSGNPGHTLQVLGPSQYAVWGAKTAHEIARRLGLQQ